jgi:hypothetical protein
VEVTLANLLPSHTLSHRTSITSPHHIEVVGAGIKTLSAGIVTRLVPADQARVDVFVTGVRTGGKAVVQVKDQHGRVVLRSQEWDTSPLVDKWTADAAVLDTHETPTWVCVCPPADGIYLTDAHQVERRQIWDLVSFPDGLYWTPETEPRSSAFIGAFTAYRHG